MSQHEIAEHLKECGGPKTIAELSAELGLSQTCIIRQAYSAYKWNMITREYLGSKGNRKGPRVVYYYDPYTNVPL